MAGKYEPSAKEQAFLDTIENPKYDREIINGLRPFFQDKAPEDIKAFYSPEELDELAEYDVVFLGDVGIEEGQLTQEQCRLLRT